MTRAIAALAFVLAALATWTQPSAAQNRFPAHNIRIVVGFPPGGGVDAVARLFAERMSAMLGQPVIVENRGGAAGLIAGKQVANAEPDGYTLLVATNSMVIAQLMNPAGGFDILRDLQAIASVAPQANVVVASPALQVASAPDLLAMARRRSLNYASPGTGSVPQLAMAQLLNLANAPMTHIPFAGAAQALTSTLSNQTDAAVVTLPPAVPFIQSGKLKGVVVTTPARSVALPEIPTAAEAGYPAVNATVWTAFFVPSRTPRAITDRLTDAVLNAAATSDMQDKLHQLGFEPTSIGGDKFQRDVATELESWADIMTKAGIKPQ
jgi:tripartite-type tricarboxylate transporter receptor subunit TctC